MPVISDDEQRSDRAKSWLPRGLQRRSQRGPRVCHGLPVLMSQAAVRLAFLPAALAMTAGAHPMGNFSVSHYARFSAQPDRLNLTYALDLAEIPTFELMQNWNLDGKDRDAVRASAAADARRWLSGLRLLCDGRPVAIQFESAAAVVSDGAGGMPVLRITIHAAVPSGGGSFEYEDANYAGRAGWKEIVIAGGDGAGLEAASHGSGDRSGGLTEYPAGEIAAPPQELKAAFRWTPLRAAHAPRPGGTAPVSQPAARVQAGAAPAVSQEPPKPQAAPGGTVVKGDYLSRMLGGREITPWMLLVGLCVAFGLGAMHAMSPGHGKTIVAAYLVGSRGTIKHALLLGGLVTFTHTASVFVLGLAVLIFETQVVPEKVFPVLGAISGLSIVAVGASLLYRRARALRSVGDVVSSSSSSSSSSSPSPRSRCSSPPRPRSWPSSPRHDLARAFARAGRADHDGQPDRTGRQRRIGAVSVGAGAAIEFHRPGTRGAGTRAVGCVQRGARDGADGDRRSCAVREAPDPGASDVDDFGVSLCAGVFRRCSDGARVVDDGRGAGLDPAGRVDGITRDRRLGRVIPGCGSLSGGEAR